MISYQAMLAKDPGINVYDIMILIVVLILACIMIKIDKWWLVLLNLFNEFYEEIYTFIMQKLLIYKIDIFLDFVLIKQ